VDVNSSIVLVAAVLASLAFGVLSAYGLCITMFRIFRIHATQVAAERQARAILTATPAAE
jgi:ABC-type glycerol-3-phosphate transport system permease component